MLRTFCLLVLIGCCSFPVAAAFSTPQEKAEKITPPPKEVIKLDGIYEVDGGAVTVRKQKEVYVIQWTNGDVGIGHLKDHTFSVGYTGSVKCGLALYQVQFDENDKIKLVGHFSSIPGNGEWTGETLTRIK